MREKKITFTNIFLIYWMHLLIDTHGRKATVVLYIPAQWVGGRAISPCPVVWIEWLYPTVQSCVINKQTSKTVLSALLRARSTALWCSEVMLCLASSSSAGACVSLHLHRLAVVQQGRTKQWAETCLKQVYTAKQSIINLLKHHSVIIISIIMNECR